MGDLIITVRKRARNRMGDLIITATFIHHSLAAAANQNVLGWGEDWYMNSRALNNPRVI
jgi:hypothetical protein